MTSPYQRRQNQKLRLAAEFAALDPEAVRDSLVASMAEVDPDSAKASIVAAFKADADREASDRNLELLAWCYDNEQALIATSTAIADEWGKQILAGCELLAEARRMVRAPALTAASKPPRARYRQFPRTTVAQRRQALLNDRWGS